MPPPIRASAFADLAAVAAAPSPMRWRRRRRIRGDVLRHGAARIGLACTAIVLLTAIAGPALAPYDPFAIAGGSLAPPSRAYLMGTDALGRDVLSGVLHGARTSLLVAGTVSLLALVCGTIVGMLAGVRGGWLDDLLMRTTELFQVIPRFFVAIVTIALLGPGLARMVLVLALTSWPTLARVVRGEVIAMRDLEFVCAAEALGATTRYIIWRQLLPNVLPTIVAMLGLLFGQVLLLEATLGFLGLGDPGAISWGMMAAQAQGFLRVAWWLALFPGLAITLSVLGANLLADAFTSARADD